MTESRVYVDPSGKLRTAAIPVPIDQFGRPTSARFRCRQCDDAAWIVLAVAAKAAAEGTAPFCLVHHKHMAPVGIPHPPFLPWVTLLGLLRPYAWPLAALAAVVGLGAVASRDGAQSLAAVAVGGPFAVWLAARILRTRLTRRAEARNRLDPVDPEVGKRVQEEIGRASRTAGYATATACVWIGSAIVGGIDPHTAAGRVVWTALPVLWLPYAATYWAWIRRTRSRPAPVVEVEPDEVGDPMEPTEALVMHIWNTKVAVEKGQMIPAQLPPGVSADAVNGKRGPT